MPDMDAFKDSENFYSTFWHEIIHSLGNSARLNRPGVVGAISFNSKERSYEELVAEIGNVFAMTHPGLSQAQKANDWIMSANDQVTGRVA